jgi:hypothetical protein
MAENEAVTAPIEIPGTRISPSLGTGYVWAPRIDPNCGEYGLFVDQNNRFEINPGSPLLTITGMRVILNNQFAPMPVCGHHYASAQFIGRGSTEFSMQLAGLGDQELSYLQAMYEEVQKNARFFRRFTGSSRVRFYENEFLRIAGISDGIITSFDTQTDADGTNLFRAQLSFTSDGHHTEGFNQELYSQYDNRADILETLLSRVNVNIWTPGEDPNQVVVDPMTGALRGGPASIIAYNTERTFGRLGLPGRLFSSTVSDVVRWGRESDPQFERNGNLTGFNGIVDSIRASVDSGIRRLGDIVQHGFEEVSRRDQRGAYITFPIETPVSADKDTSATWTPNEDPAHPWLTQYIQRICDVFNNSNRELPPQVFFRGTERGAYLNYQNRGRPAEQEESGGDNQQTRFEPLRGTISRWPPMLGDEGSRLCQMIHGKQKYWRSIRPSRTTGMNSIEGTLFEFEQQLTSVARAVLAETAGLPDFDDVFPGAIQNEITGRESSAHPTYPDLDLPRHPVSNLAIDTEPDYYFFNDGEEGLLNEIGPDIVREIDVRLENMENSYSRLSSGQTWSENYLGRSRIGIADLSEENGFRVDDNAPNASLEVVTGVELDSSTADEEVSWGEEGFGRIIGGKSRQGAPTDSESIVELVLGISPTISSSIRQGEENKVRERRLEMMRNTAFSLPDGDPNAGVQIGPVDSLLDRTDRSHSFSRNALRSIVHQSILQAPEETLTMRRAFPSFKIYFIEDDTGAMRKHLLPSGGAGSAVLPIMYFDDLYNYNSVKSIRLIRSRKNPADLLILELTNVQGLLERRRWRDPSKRQRELYAPGFEETEMENPLKKIIMKEGLRVQARLGATNNPNKMNKKFNGEVVEVSYNAEIPDLVTIICQSFGAELTLDRKGIGPEAQLILKDTPDLLHMVMCSPELVHFGRFNLNPNFNPSEARNAATSRNDSSTGAEATGLLTDPRVVFQEIQELLCINNSKWLLANNPADDNIFAPGIRDHLSIWERTLEDIGNLTMYASEVPRLLSNFLQRELPMYIDPTGVISGVNRHVGGTIAGWTADGLNSIGSYLNTSGMVLSGQTIWEILKECELRHPGWVAQARPYGTRMTMFFGIPSHPYWADEITQQEVFIMQRFREAQMASLLAGPAGFYRELKFSGGPTPSPTLESGAFLRASDLILQLTGDLSIQLATNRFLRDVGETVAKTLGRFRPFRRYHLLTSDHHILLNNIRASKKGTFNAVNLQYGGGDVYNLKADDSIPDELTRVQSFRYPSCNSEVFARRYCIGLLNRHLKDIYKGEIVVTGMDVDPLDFIYLHDDRLGMYGPAEIEQVVDTFTAETGWITEITPDLITGTNEYSTGSTAAARSAVLGTLGQRYMAKPINTPFTAGLAVTTAGGVAGAAVGGLAAGTLGAAVGGVTGASVMAAGSVLAWMGSYHIIRWTQDRQPIWVLPLIWGERPFIAGLDGFRQDGIFTSIRGRLSSQFDAIQEGWRQFHLAGYANDFTINLAQSIGGQTGL